MPKRWKAILALDPKTKEVLGRFETLAFASKATKVPKKEIHDCCTANIGSDGINLQVAGNFAWKFEK